MATRGCKSLKTPEVSTPGVRVPSRPRRGAPRTSLAHPGLRTPEGRTRLATLGLVVLVIVLLPLGGRSSAGYLPVDLPLVALCGLSVIGLFGRGVPRPTPGWALFAGVWCLLAVAQFAHPTPNGAAILVRLCGVAALGHAMARPASLRATGMVAAAIVAAAGVEAVVAVAQVVSGAPLGLRFAGERQRPFYLVGASPAPRGTFSHPYVLAAFCVVAATVAVVASVEKPRRQLWLAGGCLAGVPIGLTFSRMALAGMVAVAVVCATAGGRWRRSLARGVLVVAAGAAAAAGLFGAEGWLARAHTTASRDLDTLSSARVTITRNAVEEIETSPVVGAGPGRVASDRRQQAHNVPLAVAVEGGVAAGVAAGGLLVAVGVIAIRRGPLNTAVFVAYLPFVLLDHFPYDTGQGLALTGIWVGCSLWASGPPSDPSAVVRRG